MSKAAIADASAHEALNVGAVESPLSASHLLHRRVSHARDTLIEPAISSLPKMPARHTLCERCHDRSPKTVACSVTEVRWRITGLEATKLVISSDNQICSMTDIEYERLVTAFCDINRVAKIEKSMIRGATETRDKEANCINRLFMNIVK